MVGNRISKIVHLANCEQRPRTRVEKLRNQAEARAKGYLPCRLCHPFGYHLPYRGNPGSKIVHRRDCATLLGSIHWEFFRTLDRALSSGFRPCEKCRP